MSEVEIEGAVKGSGKRAIAFLAKELGMGGAYAEEVLSNAKVEYNKDCDKLSDNERAAVAKAIKSLFRKKSAPAIAMEDKSMVAPLPFVTLKARKTGILRKETFNEAVDEFFVRSMEQEDNEEVEKTVGKIKSKLERRLGIQKKSLDHIKKLADELKEKGDMIYTKFDKVQASVDKIKKTADEKGWKATAKLAQVDHKKKIMVIDGLNVFLDKPLTKSAAAYYERSKKTRAKIEGLEKSIRETERLMKEGFKEKAKTVSIEKRSEKKLWYEKFRWFKSSEGVLCIAGKDATTNDILIKKHVENDDKIVHAEISGSPFTVVNGGSKKTLEEAAEFTASYSKAWKAGVGVIDAYWVLPDQVSKTTKAGEYMGKGSFMVYGRKNKMKPELGLAIGFHENNITSGPILSVSSVTKKFVVIRPGQTSSRELAKQVKARIFSKCSKKEQDVLRNINIDEIQRLVPAGKGSLEK